MGPSHHRVSKRGEVQGAIGTIAFGGAGINKMKHEFKVGDLLRSRFEVVGTGPLASIAVVTKVEEVGPGDIGYHGICQQRIFLSVANGNPQISFLSEKIVHYYKLIKRATNMK